MPRPWEKSRSGNPGAASRAVSRTHPPRRDTRAFPGSGPRHNLCLSTLLFEKIDLFGTGAPLLICQAPPFPSADLEAQPHGLELLCPFGDPANVGALIRTAVAMGVERIILLKESAHPYHPKAVRAASGTMFKMSLVQGPSIGDLPEPATWVTLDAQGESLPAFQWPEDVRLLVGEEGPGLPPRASGTRLAVPMTDSVESLNAVVAAGMGTLCLSGAAPLDKPWPPQLGLWLGRMRGSRTYGAMTMVDNKEVSHASQRAS